MPEKKWKTIQDYINENVETDNISGGPPLLPPTTPEDDWGCDPELLLYVSTIVRQSGLAINEEYLKMVAISLTEMRHISETKISNLLWQYFIVVLLDTFQKLPQTQKFDAVKMAIAFGIAIERTLEWEYKEGES